MRPEPRNPAARSDGVREASNRPGRRHQPTTNDRREPVTVADVQSAVENATADELAIVLAGWDPVFGLCREPRFRCLACNTDESASVRSPARWSCSSCRHQGTVFALRRVVIEDATACERLIALLATPVETTPELEPADPWAVGL